MKIKIFLSYGMRHRTENEMKEVEEQMKKEVTDLFSNDFDIEFVSNRSYESCETKRPRVDCLGEAIKKLADVDAIYFEKSIDVNEHPGCLIEKEVSQKYNIPSVYELKDILDLWTAR